MTWVNLWWASSCFQIFLLSISFKIVFASDLILAEYLINAPSHALILMWLFEWVAGTIVVVWPNTGIYWQLLPRVEIFIDPLASNPPSRDVSWLLSYIIIGGGACLIWTNYLGCMFVINTLLGFVASQALLNWY